MTQVVLGLCDELVVTIAERALGDVDGVTTARVTTVDELTHVCHRLRPDVAVTAPYLDVPVHPAVPRLLSRGVKVMLICDDPDDPLITDALLAGASGCMSLKDDTPDEIVQAALSTAAGHAVLNHSVARAILDHWRSLQCRPSPASKEPRELTQRERQVLAAVAEGLTGQAVGRRLGIAEKTVEAHKTRIFAKLGANDQAHAVAIALQSGALVADPPDRPPSTAHGRRR